MNSISSLSWKPSTSLPKDHPLLIALWAKGRARVVSEGVGAVIDPVEGNAFALYYNPRYKPGEDEPEFYYVELEKPPSLEASMLRRF